MIYVKTIVGCYVIVLMFVLLFLFLIDDAIPVAGKSDYRQKYKMAVAIIVLSILFIPACFGLMLGTEKSDKLEMQQIVIATFEQELYACPTAHIELSSESMDALDINPCPFCGEDSTVVIANNFGEYQYYIHCSECGSRSERVADTIKQLISQWNGEE